MFEQSPMGPLKKGATAGSSSGVVENARKNTAGQASSGTQNHKMTLLQRSVSDNISLSSHRRRSPSALRRGFTLVELLVTIAIIGIMAGMVLGVLQVAQESGKKAATKATIAKLNEIIMQRYESYLTRRVPIAFAPPTAGLTDAQKVTWAKENQWKRLQAIRDLMRMEMPDAMTDIKNGPFEFTFPSDNTKWKLPEPTLHKLYAANPPTAVNDAAQCLYLIVSKGSPEAMEHFSQSEIGLTSDGKPCFIDAWGMPIMWLRWAPGYTSPIQLGVGHENDDHDPFDTRKIDGNAFRMTPLIYSAAGRKKSDGEPLYGIELGTGISDGNPYKNLDLGKMTEGGEGNITNHDLEVR